MEEISDIDWGMYYQIEGEKQESDNQILNEILANEFDELERMMWWYAEQYSRVWN